MTTQKDNQIVITELRPMSEVPMNFDSFLAFFDPSGERAKKYEYTKLFISVYKACEDVFVGSFSDEFYIESDFVGWTPMPIYKPNKPQVFNQDDVTGKLRQIDSDQEIKLLAESAAKNTKELMLAKEIL